MLIWPIFNVFVVIYVTINVHTINLPVRSNMHPPRDEGTQKKPNKQIERHKIYNGSAQKYPISANIIHNKRNKNYFLFQYLLFFCLTQSCFSYGWLCVLFFNISFSIFHWILDSRSKQQQKKIKFVFNFLTIEQSSQSWFFFQVYKITVHVFDIVTNALSISLKKKLLSLHSVFIQPHWKSPMCTFIYFIISSSPIPSR